MRKPTRQSHVARLLLGITVLAGSLLAVASAGSAADAPGLKPISQAALQTAVDTTAKQMLLPGALVLLLTPQGNFTISYGTTQRGTASPPRAATHFRIASNTKTMTAAVVLQLAQESKLQLSDPVSKYVANVPNGDNISIAQLLEMRSGLYNYTDAPEFSASLDRDMNKAWTPAEVLAIAFARPPNFAPGKEYEYSNTNYALLGLIVEKVDGKPLARSMQDRLFGPLHMQQTELPPSAVNTIPEPYAHGYLYGSTSVAFIGAEPYTPEVKAAARAGTLLPTDYTLLNHSGAAAAGGVISTADDLATWMQALVTGRVLDPNFQKKWLDSLQPVDPNKPNGQRYGYGISELHWADNSIYFHGGETAGFNSFMGYDPKNHVTLIVWSNLTVSLDQTPTANAIMLKVLDQIYTVSPLTTPKP
jgi:D-alanyl-D-alanine carboxypeptidase